MTIKTETDYNLLDWDHPSPFVAAITVHAADIDSYGHANNSVYVRWFDDCARAHSKQLGIDADQALALGYGMAVHESHIRYIASAYLDEKLLLATWIMENDGRLRISRRFQLIRASDKAVLARARLDYVCINLKTGRASKMPTLFKQGYPVSCSDS